MKTLTCGKCDIEYGVTKTHFLYILLAGAPVFCPEGHQRYWILTQDEKKARIKKILEDAETAKRETERLRESDRSNSALRGVITKLKKRLAEKDSGK